MGVRTYDPTVPVCQQWLKTGDCPVMLIPKEGDIRAGLATYDPGMQGWWMRRSRYLENAEWSTTRLPTAEDGAKLAVGNACTMFIRADAVKTVFFLDPAVWMPFFDGTQGT